MPLGLYGYGTPYSSEGALRWGKTSGNSRIAGDPSTWSANVQAITATTGKELVLHSNIFQSSAVIFGWKSIDSELSILSIDPYNDYKISNYEDFDTGMWRANVFGITDNLAALVAYEGTAPTNNIDVIETTNLTPELSATFTPSDDAPIIVESSRRTYSKIQTAYDDLYEQTDKLKIKEGELITGNLYFDRNVTVNLEGGYDSD